MFFCRWWIVFFSIISALILDDNIFKNDVSIWAKVFLYDMLLIKLFTRNTNNSIWRIRSVMAYSTMWDMEFSICFLSFLSHIYICFIRSADLDISFTGLFLWVIYTYNSTGIFRYNHFGNIRLIRYIYRPHFLARGGALVV